MNKSNHVVWLEQPTGAGKGPGAKFRSGRSHIGLLLLTLCMSPGAGAQQRSHWPRCAATEGRSAIGMTP